MTDLTPTEKRAQFMQGIGTAVSLMCQASELNIDVDVALIDLPSGECHEFEEGDRTFTITGTIGKPSD